jgi:hypothetical protein
MKLERVGERRKDKKKKAIAKKNKFSCTMKEQDKCD